MLRNNLVRQFAARSRAPISAAANNRPINHRSRRKSHYAPLQTPVRRSKFGQSLRRSASFAVGARAKFDNEHFGANADSISATSGCRAPLPAPFLARKWRRAPAGGALALQVCLTRPIVLTGAQHLNSIGRPEVARMIHCPLFISRQVSPVDFQAERRGLIDGALDCCATAD